MYFTDDIITEFFHKTNRYAKEKIEKAQPLGKRSIWRTWKNTTLEEMKAFFGVELNMDMNPKCSMKEYFLSQWTDRMPFFVDVFSCERFCQIYWILHLQQSVGQGFYVDKIQNFVDHINLKCREYFVPNENIAVNKSTVGFKGRVIWKCYNPNKPTKWVSEYTLLCDCASAYIVAFVPYYGRFTADGLVRPDLLFTSRIVLELYGKFSSSVNGTGYYVFTDRFTQVLFCVNS